MKAEVVKAGVKYAGKCAVCGGWIEGHGLQQAILLRRADDGKYAIAHSTCCKVRVIHRVAGGTRLVGPSAVELQG